MAAASPADRRTAAEAAAAQLAAPPSHNTARDPARNTVASSGGSPTTSREPASRWTGAGRGRTASIPQRAAATDAKPVGPFRAVSQATRIPKLATWIAARPNFTFAEATAARAPSPCSLTVMACILPDPRLARAVAELGYAVTAGGKNGYTVTPLGNPARPTAAGQQ